MKNFKTFIKAAGLFGIVFFFSAIFTSCDCSVSVVQNADKSLSIEFNGSVGKALVSIFEMNDSDSNEEIVIFDEAEIKDELEKSGFSDVQVFVNSKNKNEIKIVMKDKNHSSVLFSSGLLSEDSLKGKSELKTNLSPLTLKKFYDDADESLSGLLDLFLAPVFNDEEMTSEEYEEMMGTVYGEEVGNEIQKSTVKISGVKNTEIKLSDLLCGNTDSI